MLQPGFLWAPLQQRVRLVGGGALKKDGRLILWGLWSVHMLCVLWHFCHSRGSAPGGRCCRQVFSNGPGCRVLPVETCLSVCLRWLHPCVATVEMWYWRPLGRFHTSYLQSRQRVLSELGVSVFVFVWSCVFVVFLV